MKKPMDAIIDEFIYEYQQDGMLPSRAKERINAMINQQTKELREEIDRLKESKWISVEVDLPKQENIYLVECKDDYTAKFNTYGNFKGSFTNCDNNGYDYEVYPTHWQPLPNNPI